MLKTLLSPRVWFHLLVLRPFLKVVFGVSVRGKENLDGLSRFILAANHNSHLDVPVLFTCLPVRHIPITRPVAAEEYFSRNRVLFAIAEFLFRPIWIDRTDRSRDPMETLETALAAGDNLIVFPEGTRGQPGRIGKFKTGIGRLAREHREIPTVPVFLSGPERALPRSALVPLPLWSHVTIGPPQVFVAGRRDITSALEQMIRELSASEMANRHRRIVRPGNSFSVAILGIDGSGKSAVSGRIARVLSTTGRVCRISDALEFFEQGEPKPAQPLVAERVRQALGGYAKTARSLEHYKIPKLAELILRDHLSGQVWRWYASELLVLDGSPLLNIMAWARIYKSTAFDESACASAMRLVTGRRQSRDQEEVARSKLPELATLERFGLARLRIPDAVVLLDVEPAVCLRRIEGRRTAKQVHETEHALPQLREGYLMVCRVLEAEFGVPVMVLSGQNTLEDVTEAALTFIAASRRREREARDGDHGH